MCFESPDSDTLLADAEAPPLIDTPPLAAVAEAVNARDATATPMPA
jgi:hypothetical protein